jgi:regulator of sigma E protease
VVVQPTSELPGPDGSVKSAQGEPIYRIGVTPAVVYVPASFGEALVEGAALVRSIVVNTGVMLGRLVLGQLSPKDALGGPIEIVNQTARSAEHGADNLLLMMVLINIALGVMNLLPIPILDGGQICMLTIELIKGGPLSARVHAVATQVGMLFIFALMIFAFGNDLRRIFFL